MGERTGGGLYLRASSRCRRNRVAEARFGRARYLLPAPRSGGMAAKSCVM